MAGAGSALDRNDYRLIERLTNEISRVADELEELNERLDGEE